MSEEIANQNSNIRYEILQEKYAEKVFYLLITSFINDEPMSKALNVTSEAITPLRKLISDAILHQASYIAIDKTTDRVVGCRLSTLIYHYEPAPKIPKDFHEKYRHILGFVSWVMADCFQILSDAHVIMKFECLAVDHEYRRRRIAQKLIELSLNLARKFRCQYAVGVATATKSQNLFAKLGFQVLKTVQYKDYKRDDGNMSVFENMNQEEPMAQLVVKKLF